MFADCESLSSVVFKENGKVKMIGRMAFFNCRSLKEIVLPSTLTQLGYTGASYTSSTTYCRTFEGCESLLSISLPEGVTKIGQGLFKNCTSLEKVTFAANTLGFIASNAFSAVRRLKSLFPRQCGVKFHFGRKRVFGLFVA